MRRNIMKRTKLKQVISMSAITALTVALLTGCGNAAANTDSQGTAKAEENTELRTLRLAVMTGKPDHYASVIGLEEGFFEKRGIDLQVTEYALGINTGDAVQNGTADTGMLADFAAVNRFGNTLHDTNMVIFSELSNTVAQNGGIYVAPEYADDVSKLDNSPGWIEAVATASEYYNWKAQKAIGLDPAKQKPVNIDSEATGLALATKGEAAAVLATGALATRYEDIGWKLIATPEDYSHNVGYFLITTTDFLDKNADLLGDYLVALDESVKYINSNLDDAGERISAKLGVNKEDFIAEWQTHDITLGVSEEGAAQLQDITVWGYENGKFPEEYNIKDFYRTDAVAKAFPERVTIVR